MGHNRSLVGQADPRADPRRITIAARLGGEIEIPHPIVRATMGQSKSPIITAL
jgi:hypothetical protein